MKLTVFYSWENDLPNPTNRSLIGTALERAAKELGRELEVERDDRPDTADNPEFLVDRDTRGVAGTPDIAHTIFDKIRNADVFVADVTIINERLRPTDPTERFRPTPNPNVLIELGYAARHLTWDRIICAFNVAFGALSDLPFDIRNRRIIDYNQANEPGEKTDQRNHLARKFKTALQAIASTIDATRQESVIGPLQRVLSEFEHNDHVAQQQQGPSAATQFRFDELSTLITLPLFSQLPPELQSELRQAHTFMETVNVLIRGEGGTYGNRSDELRIVGGEKRRAGDQIQKAIRRLTEVLGHGRPQP